MIIVAKSHIFIRFFFMFSFKSTSLFTEHINIICRSLLYHFFYLDTMRLFAESFTAGTWLGRATVRLLQMHTQVLLQRGTGPPRADLPSSGRREPPSVGRERSREESRIREARRRYNGEGRNSAKQQGRGGRGGSERGRSGGTEAARGSWTRGAEDGSRRRDDIRQDGIVTFFDQQHYVSFRSRIN